MDYARASVVLTPSESKRLIAKAVALMSQVRQAMERGRLIIGNGTTNAYVAEELLGISVPKVPYAAGIVRNGKLEATKAEERLSPIVCVKGEQVDTPWLEVLNEFEAGDVFVKGANAVDARGIPGVLAADSRGGTVGAILGIMSARGCNLVVPVGLEKMVPSVIDASHHAGITRMEKKMGLACGLIPLPNALVVTEIQALRIMSKINVWHLASGGVAGSEGAVVLAIEGDEMEVNNAYALVESIKGEAPITG